MAIVPDYLGNLWSGFPPLTEIGTINIARGTDTIAAGIIALCLTRKGEIPHQPEYGIAPELFANFSDFDVDYWKVVVQQEIRNTVPGILQLVVDLILSDEANGKAAVEIRYQAKNAYSSRTLAFPYARYLGADYDTTVAEFLAGITIDGVPFVGIR